MEFNGPMFWGAVFATMFPLWLIGMFIILGVALRRWWNGS